jgi:hypothetical protein
MPWLAEVIEPTFIRCTSLLQLLYVKCYICGIFTHNFRQLLRVKKKRNILHEISKQKANWFSHIFRRNCLLRQVIEGKIKGGIEVTGRRGRRRRKLLDCLKERRGC